MTRTRWNSTFPILLNEDGTPKQSLTRRGWIGRNTGSRGAGFSPAGNGVPRSARLLLVEGGTAAPVIAPRQLQQRKPINPVSDKRRTENRQRRAMAEARFPDMQPMCAVPWCTRPADALHEILSRARGGSITDPANTVPACNICNGDLTLEPPWGYRLGLIRHSGLCCAGPGTCTRYPRDEPMRIQVGSITFWLLPDGRFDYEPPEGVA